MNKELFTAGLSALSASVSDKQINQFSKYSEMLVEWNEKMNLTAITDPDGITVKHFLDSILPLYMFELKEGASVADIGTGAGFPGLPIKIIRPDIKMTLVDSLNKRISFLRETVSVAEIDGVECIHARAEELGKNEEYREGFDAVVSRAVANMTVLCEYCLPFVKVGGVFLALKSEDSAEEIEAAKPMIKRLGGELEDIISAPLPMSDITRTLAVVRKVEETPAKYPRRADKIKKSANKK